MINAEELRIGNYFYYGKHNIVGTFSTLEYRRLDGLLINGQIPEEHLTPIPITPEILEKCGFEEEITEDITYYHPSGFFFFQIWDRENKKHDYYGIKLMNKFIVRLDCLHQLQNLYFALTGAELEINIESLNT